MKIEIANEFGVTLGPDTSSRQNGSVGGEITKKDTNNYIKKHDKYMDKRNFEIGKCIKDKTY
jgi:hypothetical protein